MKTIRLSEQEIRNAIRRKLQEQSVGGNKEVKKARCVPENVVKLEEIIGDSEHFNDYTSSVRKRTGGIKGMVDNLELLKTLRLNPNIKDNGEHLAYELMNHLNVFRNKNYFDETTNTCRPAMDKIIELYKSDEHGEELTKDIEKVLAHPTHSMYPSPSSRTKEYLKQCLNLVKGK